MTDDDEKAKSRREVAEEKVRAVIEALDGPTLALLYKTLHYGLGLRLETVDVAIDKLRR